MTYFILEYYWFVLGSLFRVLGANPWEKVERRPNGKVDLVSKSKWAYYGRLSIVGLISGVFGASAVMALADVSRFFDEFTYMLTAINESPMDLITMAGTGAGWMGLVFLLYANFPTMANHLGELNQFFQAHGKVDILAKTKLLKRVNFSIFLFGLFIIFASTFSFVGFSFALQFLSKHPASTLSCIYLSIVQTAQSLLLWVPVYFLILIYGEINANIEGWISALENEPYSKGFLQDCAYLAEALAQTSKIFAKCLFWIITLSCLTLVSVMYRSFAFLIGNYPTHWSVTLLSFGYMGYGVILSYVVWYFCSLSQSMIGSVQRLRSKIVSFKVAEVNEIAINGRKYGIRQATELLLHLMQFDGFSGNGYVHLNKGLISSVVATFVTYLIILIQFKITEVQ